MSVAQQFLNAGMNQLPWPFAWEVDVYQAGGGNLNQQRWAAQEVTIPNEAVTFANMAPENRGGFMPWPGVIERESFLSRPLAVNFFDFGRSDPETMAREWIKGIAKQGMRDSTSHDGSITCMLKDKMGNTRRTYNARGVFPTNVEGFTVSYAGNTFIVKTVTFSCKTLEVS